MVCIYTRPKLLYAQPSHPSTTNQLSSVLLVNPHSITHGRTTYISTSRKHFPWTRRRRGYQVADSKRNAVSIPVPFIKAWVYDHNVIGHGHWSKTTLLGFKTEGLRPNHSHLRRSWPGILDSKAEMVRFRWPRRNHTRLHQSALILVNSKTGRRRLWPKHRKRP